MHSGDMLTLTMLANGKRVGREMRVLVDNAIDLVSVTR